VQTTLLGLAIAIILALVTALVGPLFIDWNKYRGEFEARATQLTGLQVRLAGPIEARLLPTPTLTLQRIDVFRPGEAGAVRANKLGIEFSLGALMRGEMRATDVRVEGAEFTFGLDATGHLDWPAPAGGFDPDAISIERLDIVNSRAIFADSASGAGLVLDNLEFRGELRSLAGPVKGEGSFWTNSQHYPYRVSASRAGDDGAVRVRLSLDPIDRPMSAEADGSLWVERGIPRFEGSLQVARSVSRAPRGGQALIIEPWRFTSRIKGDSTAAVLEQVEFQYGPDDRAIKLKGDAKLTLGSQPQLEGVLSSTQVDLDRLLALPEPTRRRPLLAVKALTEYFGGAGQLPIPVKFGISVENVTLAGATLQRVTGDVKTDGETWDVESLDFRAPGLTQVRLSGRINNGPQGIAFAGPVKVDAKDPRAFVAWLTDRTDAPTSGGPFRAEGEVKVAGDRIGIDRLKADIDRMALEGRLAYSWASSDHPARIEAVLSAPEVDVDRAWALGQGVFGDTAFEWPREGSLSVKVGRAFFGGVEAQRADINMQFDGRGLEIERLAVGDLGGAALTVKGRIDTRTAAPHGSITLDLDARALDGIIAMAEKVAPQAADTLRRKAARFVPAKLHASLTVNTDAGGGSGNAIASFKVDGSAGTFRIDLQGDAGGAGAAFNVANISKLDATRMNLVGRIDAGDGSALVEFLGLDRLIAVDKRAGRLSLSTTGALGGDIMMDGQLTAGGLDLSAKGSLRLPGSQGPTASLDIKVTSANLRTPRSVASGRLAEILPTALTARLTFAEDALAFSDLSGKISGGDVSGRLKIGLTHPMKIDGDIEIGTINLPAVIATAIGVPASTGSAAAAGWPAEPFESGFLGGLEGQIVVKSSRVALTPAVAAQDVKGVLRFENSDLALQDINGALAGGRITGELLFHRASDGLTATSRIRIASANIGDLLPTSAAPLSGHFTLNVELEGSGRSAVALIGSVKGQGTFTLQDGRIMRLDPAAFDTIIRNVDQGLPIDATRIRDRMELALVNGGLGMPLAEGEIIVADGQARLNNTIVQAARADLAVAGSMDLAEGTLDAKLTLSGEAVAGGASNGRPEIGILLKGPIAAPKRTLDVAALASWLALRAVEQQGKRIDALESDREVPGAPAAPNAPVPPAASVPQATAPAVVPSRPAVTVPARAPPRPRPAPPAQSSVPPLPPAADIRPRPLPRQVQPVVPRGSSSLQNSIGP
jgi:large subunit ribosomal protein L24